MFKPTLEVLEDRTMPSLDFAALPPEINSGLMYSGAGSAPMLAAAAAWNGLAAAAWNGLAVELQAAALSYEAVVLTLSSTEWSGPASQTLAQAAAPYVAWMSATAVQAEAAASQAQAAASQAQAAAYAFETAFASTVPPPVIAANRTQLVSLVASNLFGQNNPAIAAAESDLADELDSAELGLAGASAGVFAAPPSTGVGAAAADEVSVAVAALFSAHAAEYQALSSMAASFHQQFVQALSAASGAYASEEAAIAGATG